MFPHTHHHRMPERVSHWLAVLLVPILALFACATASAQLSGKGEISGVVTDSSGAAIPGAQVVITSKQTGVSTKTTSTSTGDFSVPTLDPGDYTVTISAQGFQKLIQQNVHVNALETQTLSPKLTVGATSEEVTVSAAPPQLDTTSATLGTTMEQDVYSALPIEMGAYGQPDQRRATDFAFLMPGVQGNNTNGNPTTNTGVVNGSGSRGAVTAVYIDGVVFVRAGGNGDPRYVWTAMSVDAIDQFQVQTNGYSAMYEGQGVENYTVKQGGDKFHGSLYEFFRNTALDTWGFFGKLPNAATGLPQKPIEHSNEYGIDLGGPLVPFGSWRDKLFFFGNYSGYRYSSQTPTLITFPTAAEQAGNFQGVLNTNTGSELSSASGVGIYDPFSETACTANSTTGPCRYRYGFVYSGTPGPAGHPILGPAGVAGVDVVPAGEFSPAALALQKGIPALSNQNNTNNYLSPNSTALTNWSTTDRIDWQIRPSDTLTLVGAIGRQASSVPVGQTTSGRNVGPLPYNYGQAYAPKTAVAIVEETHIFTPHLVNQLKYGFARYNGPTINADYNPAYGAAGLGGITNLPSGQAADAFPITSFSGTNAPTQWAGTTASVTIAQNFTLVDNVQWNFGSHSLTLGGQIAWLQYLNQSATGGTTPLTLKNSATETGQINPSGVANNYSLGSNTGLAYASFLVGQVDSSSLTDYTVPEYASRFRAISPYAQDTWKVNSRLTLDLGLRWDYFPPVREAHDDLSFFNPNITNPVTGQPGALQFAGSGTNTCNCSTPMNTYWKNFGPRIGFAFQSDPKTVWRGSFGVMFTHGNAVGGGNASSLGGSNNSLGFSSTATTSSNGDGTAQLIFNNGNTAYPTVAAAPGRSASPATGTGYTTVSGYTGSPTSIAYFDPYYGSRAPEYINWSFGFQHQWTQTFTSTISYVGSEGHFLTTDGGNPRGYWADQLDPKYLQYGNALTQKGSAVTTFCAANAGVCPSNYALFNTGQQLNVLLRPFPFHSISDTAGNVANSVYNALQTSFNMRPAHGITFMANYTWSRSIDDGGYFRSGYPIPAAYSNNGRSWAADQEDRGVSTSNQPHHVVLTGVWQMPFGHSIAHSHEWERALLGGYKLSTIFQAFSGSPLYITASSCQTNPAISTCMANLNPYFPQSSSARINGKWGQGITAANTSAITYIAPSGGTEAAPTGPFISPSLLTTSTSFPNGSPFAPSFTFPNAPRTAPYNLYGPGNYDLDLALVRSFPLHFTEAARLELRAEWFNVTNHTWFAVASTQVGNSSFGDVTSNSSAPRKSAQLDARINF